MTHFYPSAMTLALLCGSSLIVVLVIVTIENKKASQAIKLLKWERDTAQRQLQIAESAIHYHENKYQKDIAYWKAKNKRIRHEKHCLENNLDSLQFLYLYGGIQKNARR